MFDPMIYSDVYSGYVGSHVYDGLVKYDENLKPVPWLADSWDISPDGKTYTFHLHKGVKFHDGTDFNAQAMKFSMDRIRGNKASIGYSDCGDNIVLNTEAVDDLTFRLTLADPYAPFLTKLISRCGYAVSPAAVQKLGDDEFGLHPVGTGPFKFLEWKKDDHFTVVKNENYWRMGADGKPLPYLDKVNWRVMTDSNGRLQALLNQEIDILLDAAEKDVATIKSSPDLAVAQTPWFGYTGFVLNVSKPPFNNKALAQALAYATDRDEFIRVIQEGLRPRADYGTIPPTLSWAVDQSYVPYKYDLAKAKQLLAEAGYPNGGFSFTLLADTSDPESQRQVELLQSQYKKVGIDMKIEAAPFNDVLLPRTKKGDFEASRTTVTGGIDPDTWIYSTFHTDGNLNRSHFSDPQIDKLGEDGRKEQDLNKRGEIYKQAEKLIMDRSPWIMISYSVDRFTGRKVVQGWYVGQKATAGYSEYWKTAD